MKPTNLSFDTLRTGNVTRLPLFKDAHGRQYHQKQDGSDWSPAQWLQALVGEVGEYANMRKKYERGDITLQEFKAHAERELADAAIYLDILAYQLRIDLGEAIILKFNEVSLRIGCDVMIDEHGMYRSIGNARGRQGGLITNSANVQLIKCDGDHGGSVCEDPECWLRENGHAQ